MRQFDILIIMATIINCTGIILTNINHPFMGMVFLVLSMVIAISGLLTLSTTTVEQDILNEILKQTYITNRNLIEIEIERRKELKKK
jgi:hypothetical protein